MANSKNDYPDDFVIATGKTHTVRKFCLAVAEWFGYELIFEGEGINEIGIDKKTEGF